MQETANYSGDLPHRCLIYTKRHCAHLFESYRSTNKNPSLSASPIRSRSLGSISERDRLDGHSTHSDVSVVSVGPTLERDRHDSHRTRTDAALAQCSPSNKTSDREGSEAMGAKGVPFRSEHSPRTRRRTGHIERGKSVSGQ